MSKRTVEQYNAHTTATVKQVREALAGWPDDAVITSAEVIVDDEISLWSPLGSSRYFMTLEGEREVQR